MTTALITGASAGLGVEFAHALAARGHDLILTARRGDRLVDLAAAITDRHGVAVTVLPADLARPGAAAALIDQIARRDLAVNVLINNAGFGANGAFAGEDPAKLDAMLDLNCRAVMDLARLVLPGMVQMRSGAILNVASTAAFQPGPWMALYYATKAFVLSLSEALHEEVRESGVTVTALCPGPVRTEFFDIAGMGDNALFERFASDAKSVVRDGLNALDARDAVRISGWRNRMVALSVRFAPRGFVRRTAASLQRSR
ncbi:SDR family oxidoreductase [Stakelama sp. CBK3Z-3]|uniref:SDR family oxidoreductase n=1 Tax=Stakelama flava TaxID=2860338 RepID=A0ABS6XIV1_9SPHN|nr:SDR family oxidoreductase [Stakelama flava]MBW4330149.1 SDR family oxidoreductase [Stakelama flava]